LDKFDQSSAPNSSRGIHTFEIIDADVNGFRCRGYIFIDNNEKSTALELQQPF